MAAIFEPIPMPKSGIDAFMEGMASSQKMFDSLAKNKRALEESNRAQEMQPYDINYKQAQTDLIPSQIRFNEAHAASLNDPLNRDLLKAKISAENELATQRKNGLSGLGTGGKEEQSFQKFISMDNPQLGNDPAKVYEAANEIREGRNTLSDGTVINPMSPAAKESLNRLTKYGSTNPLVTQGVNAVGGEAEISKMSELASKWNKPYGTTYLNKSPDQIIDTFKNDEKSQTRLGEFIAGQQLQNEIAQIQTRIAMGQPGITQTHDLMKMGMQKIDARYPRLSQKAREVAQKRFAYALTEGLHARQGKGIGATTALGNNNQKDAVLNSLPNNQNGQSNNQAGTEGQQPKPGMIWMQDAQGNQYQIHKANVDIAKKGYGDLPPLKEVE